MLCSGRHYFTGWKEMENPKLKRRASFRRSPVYSYPRTCCSQYDWLTRFGTLGAHKSGATNCYQFRRGLRTIFPESNYMYMHLLGDE